MIQQFKCVHNLNRLRIFSWNDSQGGHLIKLGNKYKQFIIFFNIYWRVITTSNKKKIIVIVFTYRWFSKQQEQKQ